MKMLKMCLNWKVIAALAVVGAGIYAFVPGLAATAFPILLLAICPLSMLLMMWGMQSGQSGEQPEEASGLSREEQLSRLREQQAALADRIGVLEHQSPAGDGGNSRHRAGS